jgi:hypothetical protein
MKNQNDYYYEVLPALEPAELRELIRCNVTFGVPGYRAGVTVASLKELWGRAELLTLLAVRGMLLIIFEGLIR